MKALHWLFLLVFSNFLLASSCNEDSEFSQNIAWTTPMEDSLVVAPTSSTNFAVNIPNAIYTTTAGNITSSGLFAAPANQGKVVITATNPGNNADKVTKTVFVSSYKTLFTTLSSGGYVLSFRHGDASNGSDILNSTTANWWKSCDATLARQLTPNVGPLQCQELGRCMRLLKLPVSRVISSEYCRCKTTAELFGVSGVPVVLNQDITYYVYDEANRYSKQMALIQAQPNDAFNTLMVGHAGFSNVPANPYLNNLQWGDAAVFKLNGASAPTYVTTILQGTLRAMLQ
jgi:phosphohistidine phosphatase SixA